MKQPLSMSLPTRQLSAPLASFKPGEQRVRSSWRHKALCALSPLGVVLATSCSADATIALTSPAEGEELCGASFHVVTDVQNFELEGDDAARNADPSASHVQHEGGHVHVFMNGVETYQAEVAEFDVLGPFEDGEYQLKVELVNGDHSAVEPYAGDFHNIIINNSLCIE